MKRLITAFLLLISITSFCQVTIDDIKQNSVQIDGELDANSYVQLNDYRMDESQEQEISGILASNVFWYYNLSSYDSDLKRKVFSESEEYKSKLTELNQIKSDLLKQDYYLELEIADYEKRSFKYDLNSKTFSFTISSYQSAFYNDSYLQFDNICFRTPTGIFLKNSKFHSGQVDVVKQFISINVADERIALKIEENVDDMRILFLFKFSSAKEFINYPFGPGGYGTREYYLLTNLNKAIVYNSRTGEVYQEFK